MSEVLHIANPIYRRAGEWTETFYQGRQYQGRQARFFVSCSCGWFVWVEPEFEGEPGWGDYPVEPAEDRWIAHFAYEAREAEWESRTVSHE